MALNEAGTAFEVALPLLVNADTATQAAAAGASKGQQNSSSAAAAAACEASMAARTMPRLIPGQVYEYKYLVDGNWMLDIGYDPSINGPATPGAAGAAAGAAATAAANAINDAHGAPKSKPEPSAQPDMVNAEASGWIVNHCAKITMV